MSETAGRVRATAPTVAAMGEVIRFPASHPPAPTERLWRDLAGEQLRTQRLDRGLRLVDVAERAGVSPQYLSEVERGLKDPSSELLAAMVGALGLSVAEIATRVASTRIAPQSPVCLAA
jgi:DNA-binding XRE family transcriptional regulator